MNHQPNARLTDRQQRELDYHREHAKTYQSLIAEPFSWDVLQEPERRWWNAYWSMYALLTQCDLKDKSVLIIGCGFGDDALRLAKLGAKVSAFDLSPDSINIARELAKREQLEIDFDEMPAETLRYESSSFDCIIARDILHHVDIPLAMSEVVRVAKHDALFVMNEIYSHSRTDKIRHSYLIEKVLYPRMRRFIYGPGRPYITEDERKLSEVDVELILMALQGTLVERHFNFLVTRIIPDRHELFGKADQGLLRLLKPIGRLLAGRILIGGRVSKRLSGG